MKKIYVLLLAIGLIACNQEDQLTPSNIDEDRLSELIDLSKPLVKEYKENYDVNILLNFNDTLDFKFGLWQNSIKDMWANFKISHVNEGNEDETLGLFDEIVLQAFQDDITAPAKVGGQTYHSEFKKKYFPHKILLADTITTDGKKNCPDVMLAEAEVMAVTEDTWYALWNGYEQIFAVSKPQWDKLTVTNKNNVKKRMFFSFLVNIINEKKLYSQIPEAFFTPVEGLHNKDIKALALVEDAPTHPSDTSCISVQWYIDKGMALLKNSPVVTSSSFAYRLNKSSALYFPNRERDVRNFLNVIICENATTNSGPVRGYYLKSPLFKQRMKVMIETLYSWGIDVFKINPVMEEFYN